MSNNLTRLFTAKAEDQNSVSRVNLFFLPGLIDFPLVIKSGSKDYLAAEWIKENRDLVCEKLNRHGAVLFRGFAIDTIEKFQQFITVFDAAPIEYKMRSSPRYEVAKNVYHSTTYPEDQCINMHSENSYAAHPPSIIIFCCIKPADEQGETPIADNRMVLAALPPVLRTKFEKKGVMYVRNLTPHIGLPWQEVFQTTDKLKVEQECRLQQMHVQWNGENDLTISWHGEAIVQHPVTTEMVWFNHGFFFNKYSQTADVLASVGSDKELPFNTFFGDGSAISKEEITQIRDAYQMATKKFAWMKGDVLYMDNRLMSHGRSPYKGEREIIVSMF